MDWHSIPEIIGCNALLRMGAIQAIDAVEQGRHIVIEGEAGSGRRLLARTAWSRRSPGTRSLFTLDCQTFHMGSVEDLLLFAQGHTAPPQTGSTLRIGRLQLPAGSGMLLLHVEALSSKLQHQLAHLLQPLLGVSRQQSVQLMMTLTPSLAEPHALDSALSSIAMRVRMPALRERVEDIRPLTEAFLRDMSPFRSIRCSQALIEKFCTYEWPGNVSELRSILRKLLLLPHNGLLDVRHLRELTLRNTSHASLLHAQGYSYSNDSVYPASGAGENGRMQ